MTVEDIMKRLEAMGSEQTKKRFSAMGLRSRYSASRWGPEEAGQGCEEGSGARPGVIRDGQQRCDVSGRADGKPEDDGQGDAAGLGEAGQLVSTCGVYGGGVAAESPHALALAREWMKSDDEMIATCGWSTYANYISTTQDEDLIWKRSAGFCSRSRA